MRRTQDAAAEPSGAVLGRVFDHAGNAVPGATVAVMRVEESDETVFAVTTTGPDGQFRFATLPPSSFAITATHPELGHAFEALAAPLTGRTLDLSLTPGTRIASGTLVDEQGTPVAGGRVDMTLANQVFGDTFITRTDSAGHFALSLAEGGYSVFARIEDEPVAGFRFQLTENADLKLRAFRAEPSTDPPTKAELEFVQTRRAGCPAVAARDPFSKELLDGVSVVGLGEQTHGSQEGNAARFALARLLIQRHDFTVVALEAGYAETLALDAWVAGGPGDAAGVIGGLMQWIWNSAETDAFIRWVRAENRHRPAARRIRIVGLDVQSYDGIKAELVKRLERAGTPEARSIIANLTKAKSCTEAGVAQIANQKSVLSSDRVGQSLFEHLAQCAAQDSSGELGDAARDAALAANTLEIVETAGSPNVVVIAHNGHVARERVGGIQHPPMGELLAKRLGRRYLATGFLLGNGKFRGQELDPKTGQSPDLRELSLDDIAPGSLEDVLSQVTPSEECGFYLLPLRDGSETGTSNWPGPLRRMRFIGASYAPAYASHYWHPVVAARAFDAITFVPHTTTLARPRR